MGGFQSSQDDYSPVSEINITPFVDVMLVLLIIFMVTAPLLESGIAIQLPRTISKAIPKSGEPVTLHLTRDKKIFLNKNQLNPNNLVNELRSFYKNRQKKEIFIRADGALPYSFVAKTMATIKSAGIHKIGLVTLPEMNKQSKGS